MKNLFKINGLTCDACVKLVSKKLAKIKGVSELSIDKRSGTLEINSEKIIEAREINNYLKDTDYKIENI